jgi:hypothetical protein
MQLLMQTPGTNSEPSPPLASLLPHQLLPLGPKQASSTSHRFNEAIPQKAAKKFLPTPVAKALDNMEEPITIPQRRPIPPRDGFWRSDPKTSAFVIGTAQADDEEAREESLTVDDVVEKEEESQQVFYIPITSIPHVSTNPPPRVIDVSRHDDVLLMLLLF